MLISQAFFTKETTVGSVLLYMNVIINFGSSVKTKSICLRLLSA